MFIENSSSMIDRGIKGWGEMSLCMFYMVSIWFGFLFLSRRLSI